MNPTYDANAASCPLPLRDYPTIVLAHGGGGRLMAELIEHLFLAEFADETLSAKTDAAVLPLPTHAKGRLALTTDCHVVRPLFFPGGSLAELAVHGTINDLAMSGAQPLYLTVGFILEEGLPIAVLAELVRRLAQAARQAGMRVVAGDTKVVERGHGDGCFITTSGVGVVAAGIDLGPQLIRPGDVVLVNGPIGEHGMAVLSVREGLEFESPIVSDCRALHLEVDRLLRAVPNTRFLRDPTRGGVAAVLHEVAQAARWEIALDEAAIPVRAEVRAACEILGLDPLYVANEGKLIAIVPPEAESSALTALGPQARRIGVVRAGSVGRVVARTPFGTERLIPLPLGEQLPRIC